MAITKKFVGLDLLVSLYGKIISKINDAVSNKQDKMTAITNNEIDEMFVSDE